MSAYIIFNGVSSGDKGFIVEKLPDEHRPARKNDTFEPAGRNGTEHRDRGTYKPYNTDVKINLNGHGVNTLYEWLNGEGWITTSDSPDVMRWASFYSEQKDARFRIGTDCYDTVTIPVEMQPFAYLTGTDAADIVRTSAGTFAGKGTVEAEPLLAVQGSGDVNLMLNGSTVLIDGLSGTIYLDSEAHVAYKETGGVKNIYMMPVSVIDKWPTLLPGTNTISWTGSVTKVTITPRWRRQ